MSHISNLRLLFSPLLPTLRSPFSSKRRPYSLLTILSSSSPPHPKRRHRTTPNHLSLNFRSRSKTTSRETRGRDRDEGKSMDESGKENPGFNKKRAEGRDNTKRNLQLKVRKLNPTNTISYVQILGTGMDTQDTSPSVLLFFDKQRFIFNAGEGLQRFCTEHKIKLSKIDHIFLSRVCSETAGGIPGLLLTLAGMGEEGMSVNIWGPSDLKYLVDAMKSFIPHAAMVHTKSFGNGNVGPVDANKIIDPIVLINDEVVKISAILLRPNQSQGSALKPGDMSVIYLCELAEIMGKFDPEKAKALGLKPGPKYRELQSGRSVMSDHQDIMVHPSDVMDPSVPGPIVLLVDCPTESHVQELLSTESLNSYYVDFSGNPTQIGKTVNCIIHLSPASVTRSPTYQKWMKKFGPAQHIMAGHEMKNVEIPILKSNLNNSRPDLIFSGEGCVSKLYENTSAENLLKFTLRPHANLGFDKSNIPSLMAPSEIINELLSEIPEIVDAAQHVREFWSGPGGLEADINVFQGDKVIEEPWLEENTLPSCLENIRRDDLEVVLLGTGSSQPSKYRNVTSIYINLFSKGSLLLDCGEGTLGQLKRRYGVEGADDAVRKLRCIWISHIHADHHTGLARILALRRDLLKGMTREPILVVGPWQLKKFLDAYQILEDLDMQFIDCRSTTEASWVAFEDDSKSKKDDTSLSSPNDFAEIKNSTVNTESNLFARGSRMQSYWKRPGNPVDNGMVFPSLKRLKEVLSEAGLEALISFPVVHCPQAFGIALKASERINTVGKAIPGWKIVYSGDTRPCPELVEASRGATILIHEATFEDALVEEAIARNHSTTEEAIEVGNSAGAYRIILTHFSQRYPENSCISMTHICIKHALLLI
ncbi:ZINC PHOSPHODIESTERASE ELAC PROTEIN 2 [Salix purpurea]|uniref:ribonuclease Z n=1 Tax=Salix purpurea TaxID=77065 RepID=A0A9Q0YVD9_SALPP|nr:ZINC PHOSPHODIESTERASE ELAC PROTEIN 2 [Salix purpurea]